MVGFEFGNRARIVLLLLCAGVIPSCGGGNHASPASPSRINTNPSVSRDGRRVVFESSSGADRQVVVIDRVNATSQVVAASDDIANAASTPDGRFIAFDSRPSGSETRQVFLQDLTANTTTLVSETTDGVPGDGDSTTPSVSDDGRFVAFQSRALNLGARSASSNSILFRDLASGTIKTASSTDPANDVNPAVSGNGQYVAFESQPPAGTGFSSVQLYNGQTGDLFPVSQTPGAPLLNGDSGDPSLTFDGQRVAFESTATNFSPATPEVSTLRGESNILVRDVVSGAIAVASVPLTPGVPADGDSHHPTISGDGHLVAFDSTATNLTADVVVPGESNIFVRDLSGGSTELVTPVPASPPPATPTTPPTPPPPTTPATAVAPPPPAVASPTTLVPGGAEAGLSTGAPVQPTGIATEPVTAAPVEPPAPVSGLSSGTPVQPTTPVSGLTTSTPVQPPAPVSGPSTVTPVQPTTPVSGLSTSVPVQPTTPVSGLSTSVPVQPTTPVSGLSTSTPVQPTTPVSGVSTSTPVPSTTPLGVPAAVVPSSTGTTIVITAAENPRGSVRPRISSDGAWIVFESRGRILLAQRGTGEISEIRGPVPPLAVPGK